MAKEENNIVELRDEFYRDSFGKVIVIIISMISIIAILGSLSLFFYFDKPPPIIFQVGDEMRVQPPVPLNEPYLSNADVLQWVVDVVPKAFNLDFNFYNDQLKVTQEYFTQEGWKTFLNQLNIYANYNNVQSSKLFVTAAPSAAPTIANNFGIILDTGKYGWVVLMPLTISYAGYQPPSNVNVTLQILVVRVPTLNNLSGVSIDNVVQAAERATDLT